MGSLYIEGRPVFYDVGVVLGIEGENHHMQGGPQEGNNIVTLTTREEPTGQILSTLALLVL